MTLADQLSVHSGPAMLASTQEQVAISQRRSCSFAPPSEDSSAPVPSHKLLITFQDASQPFLLPVHGLVWALTSPLLASLATTASPEAPPFPIALPSSAGFHLFHTWMYIRSTRSLLGTLLTFPNHAPTPTNASPEGSAAAHCSAQEPEMLLAKLELLSGLYRNAVALQVWDDELWATMKSAWRMLVEGLQVSLNRRRREQSGEAE